MLVYLKCSSFAYIYYLGEQRCDTIPYPSNALEVLMFVRGSVLILVLMEYGL